MENDQECEWYANLFLMTNLVLQVLSFCLGQIQFDSNFLISYELKNILYLMVNKMPFWGGGEKRLTKKTPNPCVLYTKLKPHVG